MDSPRKASSSTMAVPGSLLFQSVHSGVYPGILSCRAVRMSWYCCRTRLGGSGGIERSPGAAAARHSLGDEQRVDQVVEGVRGAEPVLDVDQHHVRLAGRRADGDVDHVDPGLPAGQGVVDLGLDGAPDSYGVGLEDQIVDPAAEGR